MTDSPKASRGDRDAHDLMSSLRDRQENGNVHGDQPPPRKKSRWEQDTQENDEDVLAREAELARAKAAAKAARQRLKEARKSKPTTSVAGTTSSRGSDHEIEQEGNSQSALSALRSVRGEARVPTAGRAQPRVPSRSAHPPIHGCRSVYVYERLNHIEEGSYGVVFRAREKETGEIVALKKLKMDKEKNGFPITSLREIRTLMEARHPNVVQVKEIVVGDTLTQIFIVMEFVEHDLKTLLSTMRTSFIISEIKTLMHQLLSAVALLHSNWIIHRDLKTSNLLMSNRGQLKVADFGLARMYGDPLEKDGMTSLVVTLWYRAPELLLGAREYDTAIDMWSVGCIFAELLTKEPLFMAKNETEQIAKIFRLLGQPTEDSWPGFQALPLASSLSVKVGAPPFSTLRQKFAHGQARGAPVCSEAGLDLLQRLLTYDPRRRITAEDALRHHWFKESPAPAHPDTFGSFPSVAAGERRRDASPSAPQRIADQKLAYKLELDI
ncbi:Pkinase-domain-containing protein [Tilletiaria anomala UBC 951]|uniref:cyclin-dependent kinase n=1 Tax=Tilletiaria anomala (strain ATCC 24038 / CBS 436.72 / UBC 951) TaxID=1037660 RepID=A0A066VSH0_TILAU|nr:Pkinase-domain-containing protein [Tilletiaria anomala UBC 951]KDN44386.1 Pkinase-domain-containing protein [Tilletiaria anomala UBC 951]